MDFINDFVCFNQQELDLVTSQTTVEINSPFVNVTNVGLNVIVKGLKLNLPIDKCLMLFLINSTNTPFTLINQSQDVPINQRVKVSTGLNKIIQPNSYEVLVYCGNCWMIRDITNLL